MNRFERVVPGWQMLLGPNYTRRTSATASHFGDCNADPPKLPPCPPHRTHFTGSHGPRHRHRSHDGLTVPFDWRGIVRRGFGSLLVVGAGMAEVAAGTIAMGAGRLSGGAQRHGKLRVGYAGSGADHELPGWKKRVRDIFASYGLIETGALPGGGGSDRQPRRLGAFHDARGAGAEKRKRGGGCKAPEYRGLLSAGRLVLCCPTFSPAGAHRAGKTVGLPNPSSPWPCSATQRRIWRPSRPSACRPAWWGAWPPPPLLLRVLISGHPDNRASIAPEAAI